jgi:Asp-tRNA(Asn)/Glu-tRNA(Gln) amidotransferase A subunit family amidase
MNDLESLSASDAALALAQGKIKAEHLVLACLDRIGQRERTIKAWVSLGKENAIVRARQLDRGASTGLLHGLPIGVKDLFDTYDLPTAYGSPIYRDHQPATDAVSIALMRKAGGIILGKTVTTEFATFKSGPTANPHNTAHTPGGSSSGSAAAVADFMVPLATGTQTAASIIRPASFCGVVGYKPSYGKVSIAGVKSLSISMDTLGCFGRTVSDVALGVAAMSGDHSLASIDTLHHKPRIALANTVHWPLAQKETITAMAMARFAANTISHHGITEASLPAIFDGLADAQSRIMTSEMSRSLLFERVHYPKLLGTKIAAQLKDGAAIPYETYTADLIYVAQARQAMDQFFTDYADIIITPSAIGEAPATKSHTGDPIFCRSWSVLGYPCININVSTGPNHMPVGVQLVAGLGRDRLLLSTAKAFVQALADPASRAQA